MSVVQISAKALQEKLQSNVKPLILDVREFDEFEFSHIEESMHIPLGQIPERIAELSSDRIWVVLCHHGMRSQQAANFLVQSGFSQIYNLSGGIDAWSIECDSSVLRY